MAPLIKGNVKVYASTDPNYIPEDSPVAMANIADQRMTIVTTDPTRRYYYTLVFNDKYRVKIATRNVNIPGIQNFRYWRRPICCWFWNRPNKRSCWRICFWLP